MSKQQNLIGNITLVAGEDLLPYTLVQFEADTADVLYYDTTGGTGAFGVVQSYAADGDAVAVKPISDGGGTYLLQANDAIAKGVEIYADSDGKVTDVDLGTPIGFSLTSCAAAGLVEAVLY